MSTRTLGLSDALNAYLHSVTIKETSFQQRLRAETAKLAQSNMQISPEQGQFMALLTKLINARSALEIGVFTGYSALSVAQAMPADGRIIACDVSEEWTAIAKSYWADAGVASKIDLRLAPAVETLEALVQELGGNHFDMAFIDADKVNYLQYYEYCLTLVRPGGLILVDNTLWDGAVADPTVQDEDTVAIRELNQHIAQDSRVDSTLVTIADGVTMVLKR